MGAAGQRSEGVGRLGLSDRNGSPSFEISRYATERLGSNRLFDLLIQPLVDPAESLAIDAVWTRTIASREGPAQPLLRVYDFAGDVLSLGRFHSVPTPLPRTRALRLHRRYSGGRCVPFGQGFVGLSIALPHRSALVFDDAFALSPTQVLNRCVRGILSGLKTIGVPAFYPGRDWVTVDRRVIAMISFDVGSDGALLFEAVLAVSRDFGAAAKMASSLPPRWAARTPRLGPGELTSLTRELGVELTLAEIAEIFARGYNEQFGVMFTERVTPPGSLGREVRRLSEELSKPDHWLSTRCVHPGLDHHGATEGVLGVFEAYFSLDAGALKEVLFSGDFIANSTAIADLECRLKGCPADHGAIDAIVSQVFDQRENFLLGLSHTSSIATAICNGLA